jgi:fatty-acyl-CoA synthase
LTRDELRPVTPNDRALRIFTSGTTGLPKAAEVSHRRLVTWIHWFARLAGLTASDRLYNCLPMHHSVGGVVAVGAPLVFGGSVAIAERFAARNFWHDVARWECTAFRYIGELCHYLLVAPVGPADRSYHARIAIGNARSVAAVPRSVWTVAHPRVLCLNRGQCLALQCRRQDRLDRPRPPYLALRYPIALVRFDHDSQMPFRKASGFCERCADSEVGEALGRIGKDPGELRLAETARSQATRFS